MRCLSTILVVFVVALVADSADKRPNTIVELIVASGKARVPGDVNDQRATSIGLNVGRDGSAVYRFDYRRRRIETDVRATRVSDP